MIDEKVLEQQLHMLADQLSVPPDGIDTILALRDRQEFGGPAGTGTWADSPAGSGRRVPRMAIAIAAALVVVLGIGVEVVRRQPRPLTAASKFSGGAATTTPLVGTGVQPLPQDSVTSSGGGTSAGQVGGAASVGGAATAAGGAPAAGTPAAPAVQARVIKTGLVEIEVAKGGFPAAFDKLSALAAAQGGFVASSHTTEDTALASPSGSITLRVPVAGFDDLVHQVRGLGRVLQASSQGQDVTTQFVDLDARIGALQAARQQYVTLLSRANNIGDILNVQQHIFDLQAQIEQLQGQRKVLDDQSSLSTLEVRVSEAGAPRLGPPAAPRRGWARAWHQAVHGFVAGAEWVVGASGAILFGLLIVLVAAVAGRTGWRLVRRFRI